MSGMSYWTPKQTHLCVPCHVASPDQWPLLPAQPLIGSRVEVSGEGLNIKLFNILVV
jgi:hypothetical protein